jgi:ABC-type glycerol-3-phosphate transport system substrate-binding protein
MNTKARRPLILVLVLVAMLFALSAVTAQDRVQVTFWQFETGERVIAAWEALIADFEALNPNIDVVMEIVPWAEQQQRLTTALTTNALPDISMLGNNVVAQYQAIGALTPLTDYFEAWSAEVGYDVTTDFWPGDTYYYLIEGDWWGSPVAVETRALWYRADLLEAAGYTEPPQTWDEVREIAIATTTDDIYGFGIPGGISYSTVQTFISVYLSYGARMLNEEGLCGFDTPEFKEALRFYTDLYLVDGVTPADTPTIDFTVLSPLMANGQMAMYITGPTFVNHLLALNPQPDWVQHMRVAPIPAGPEGRFGFLGGWPLVLWSSSNVKDAAFEFIKYATGPEGGLAAFSQAAVFPPGRRSVVDSWLSNFDEPWRSEFQAFVEQFEFAYPYQYPDPEIPQMGTLEVDTIQSAVQAVMLGGDIDEAVANMCDRMNTTLLRSR